MLVMTITIEVKNVKLVHLQHFCTVIYIYRFSVYVCIAHNSHTNSLSKQIRQ